MVGLLSLVASVAVAVWQLTAVQDRAMEDFQCPWRNRYDAVVWKCGYSVRSTAKVATASCVKARGTTTGHVKHEPPLEQRRQTSRFGNCQLNWPMLVSGRELNSRSYPSKDPSCSSVLPWTYLCVHNQLNTLSLQCMLSMSGVHTHFQGSVHCRCCYTINLLRCCGCQTGFIHYMIVTCGEGGPGPLHINVSHVYRKAAADRAGETCEVLMLFNCSTTVADNVLSLT